MTYWRYIFHLHREYIYNYIWSWYYSLVAYPTIWVLVKFLSVYKSLSYIYRYSLLHSIFSSLWLTYNYNFIKFIQSNNTYIWNHIRWIYAMPFFSEYHFLDPDRSNALETNLMSVYVIRSYVHIASTSKHVVAKKRNCC